jgi:hypothetical protein
VPASWIARTAFALTFGRSRPAQVVGRLERIGI